MFLHPWVCKHHKHPRKYAQEHSSTQEGEISPHCLNFVKTPSQITGKEKKSYFRFDQFNEAYTVNVYLGDLSMDLYRHVCVCVGFFVLCVSAVIPCDVCDRSFPRRVKEHGARSRESISYCKVNRQVKEA